MPSKNSYNLACFVPALARQDSGVNAYFTLKNALRYNTSTGIPGLNLGYSTRDSKKRVESNRNFLFRQLNIGQDGLARGEQVHGDQVRNVTSGGLYPKTDGLITQIPGLALGVQVADCAAILLYDPDSRTIGAVHAGWRGASAGIVIKALDRMEQNQVDLRSVHAYISPCISRKHFEVGEEVAELFPDDYVDRESSEKPHVDLKGFISSQLRQSGVPVSQIEIDRGCTFTDQQLFYSYRREGEQSGRMFALIQLLP